MNVEWFAGRLRELRTAAGLTRAQLAERAGLKTGGVRNLEQGGRKPAWPTVLALCQALGVTPDAFITAPQPRPPSKLGRPRTRAPDQESEESASNGAN